MKKLRDWLKDKRNATMLMNGCFGAAIGMFGTAALVSPYSWMTIIYAYIAGFYTALILANHFLERARTANARLIQLAEEQQAILASVMEQKSHEIAAELASRMHDAVSIVPPSSLTKH